MLLMSKKLKILVAQLNPVVGDIRGNLELARGALAEGKAQPRASNGVGPLHAAALGAKAATGARDVFHQKLYDRLVQWTSLSIDATDASERRRRRRACALRWAGME